MVGAALAAKQSKEKDYFWRRDNLTYIDYKKDQHKAITLVPQSQVLASIWVFSTLSSPLD